MVFDFPGLILRLSFAGPLLYIGLSMALHPESFLRSVEALAQVVQNFGQQLRRPLPVPVAGARPRFRAAGWKVRLAGTVVILLAFVWLLS